MVKKGRRPNLYILSTGDYLELPLMVGTYEEISAYTGITKAGVKSGVFNEGGRFGGYMDRPQYVVTKLEERDE